MPFKLVCSSFSLGQYSLCTKETGSERLPYHTTQHTSHNLLLVTSLVVFFHPLFAECELIFVLLQLFFFFIFSSKLQNHAPPHLTPLCLQVQWLVIAALMSIDITQLDHFSVMVYVQEVVLSASDSAAKWDHNGRKKRSTHWTASTVLRVWANLPASGFWGASWESGGWWFSVSWLFVIII